MDCLINYIGIKDCTPAPVSGLYINSLPGISTEIINAIADKEEVTHTNVWADVNTISAKRFATDILGRLRKTYKLKKLRGSFEFVPEDGVIQAASAEYRGLSLSFVYESEFQSFSISGLYLYSKTAGESTLKIWDRTTELYSKAITVVVGLNYFPVDRVFSSDGLFAGFDFTNIDGVESSISSAVQSCFCQAINFCSTCDPAFSGGTRFGGVVTKTATNAHGVGILGNAACDYSSIVCNNKSIFTSAWLFLLGNQLLLHLLAADRLNKFTTADREKFNELKDFYQVQYEIQLAESIEGIGLHLSDCCVECNPMVKVVEWLP